MTEPAPLRIGSLCSGAGMLDLAVQAVWGGEITWHCENDPEAIQVLQAHWPRKANLGDIRRVDWCRVDLPDILTAGWPCQPFSNAGKRKGAADERAIWPHIADAVRFLEPRIVVLENVPAVFAIGEFTRVATDLASCGYDLCWARLRASDIGAPHVRERVFVIAKPAGCGWPPLNAGAAQRAEPPHPTGRGARDDYAKRVTPAAGALVTLPTPVTTDARDGARHTTTTGVAHPGTSLTDALRLMPGDGLMWYDRCPYYGSPLGDCVGVAMCPDCAPDSPPEGGALLLLPTPAAADGERGQDLARVGREDSGADDLVTTVVKTTRDSAWGRYGPAITRWEQLTRRAPAPTEPNSRGNPRLHAPFSEWMLGWPAGWVTEVVERNPALRIIGNGVVVPQAVAAIRALLDAVGAAT